MPKERERDSPCSLKLKVFTSLMKITITYLLIDMHFCDIIKKENDTLMIQRVGNCPALCLLLGQKSGDLWRRIR